jgi:hypothetical protein
MNLKKFLVIFVALIIGARIFASLIAKALYAPSQAISTSLPMQDINVFDYFRHGDRNEPNIKVKNTPKFAAVKPVFKAAIPVVATVPVHPPKKMSAKEVSKILAANAEKVAADKKIEDEKKEKERRKKRRKKLEDIANKQIQTLPATQVISQIPTPLSQPYAQNGLGQLNVSPLANDLSTGAGSKKLSAPSKITGITGVNSHRPPTSQSNSNLAALTQLLVNKPSATLMQSFINLFHEGKITLAQYYEVLSAMQKSRTVQSRQLAVTALTNDKSQQAFEIIVADHTNESDPSTLAISNQSLQSFATLTEINVLSAELTSGSAQAKLEAAVLINQLVRGFAVSKSVPQNATVLLNPLIPILANAATGSQSDQQFQSIALNTIQLIQHLPQVIVAN